MANLLVCHGVPTGTARFTDWMMANADRVGRAYASEISRHFR
jgi:hypothetical protein